MPYSDTKWIPIRLKLLPLLRSVFDTAKEHGRNEKKNKAEVTIKSIAPCSPSSVSKSVCNTDKRLHQPITDLMESRSQDWYQEPIVNIIYKLITNQGVSHLREKQVVMKKTKNSIFRSS